jgi:glycosyltransferase involved in cell wall biosynthesis
MLFESCKEFGNNIHIIVAGMGPDYDYIKEKSSEYNNVDIIGAYNYERDIIDLYSKIDVVYSVYDAEDFNVRVAIPNRLYESIVCGLPIIVAKNTALSWVVKKYGVGFEVSSSNVNEIKELIKNILDNPDILKRCKENALKIRKNFYYENVEDIFIDKITKMVKIDEG